MASNFTDDVLWSDNTDMEINSEYVSSSSREIQMEPPVSSTTNKEGQSIVPARMAMKRPHHFGSRNGNSAKVMALASPWSNKPSGFPYSPFGEVVPVPSKHPVSLLNEQFPKIIYKLESVNGPSHCPNFVVTVTVMDSKYTGTGKSKREARSAAALNCLNAIRATQAAAQLPRAPPNDDFASDADAVRAVRGDVCSPYAKTIADAATARPATAAEKLLMAVDKTSVRNGDNNSKQSLLYGSIAKAGKSPINVLYETYKDVSFGCVSSDGDDGPSAVNANQRFKMVCSVLGRDYEGYGASKKLAKLAAARSALAILNERGGAARRAPSPAAVSSSVRVATPPHSAQDHDDESTPLANRIGKLIVDKFTDLMRLDPSHSKRKVLAGIVMTDSNFPDQLEVIGVSTGTKCVNGDHMSIHGMVMNDCHAEVIARRCFVMHLYNQLRMYAEAADPRRDIFESDLEPHAEGAWLGYRMRPSKSVHLYISTAPCGDSRIFSPHEEQSFDKHPNRMARGQLRNKIESGEGTIPLIRNTQNFRQTWDGVIEGERLLTMSCSDKVARWNFLGLQGSLLSHFVQPIYLESVVLGSLLHRPHLRRALYGRLETHLGTWIEPLPPPPPFRPQRPSLMRSSTTAELRMTTRAPLYSMAWTKGQQFPEIVNAATGTTEAGHAPRLCKQAMFARWIYISKKLPIASYGERLPLRGAVEDLIYFEVKDMASLYQKAKICLYTAFERANLGRWVKKPIEQDQFPCRATNASPQDLFD